MMLLVSNAKDWFFAVYNETPFGGVLFCWAAVAIITAVVLSMNRSVIGQVIGFGVSMIGAVWILTYMDLSTFYGLERRSKEVIKNLVIMSLGGVSSALLVSAMLSKPKPKVELRQRAFVRHHLMKAFQILFWFVVIASLLMLVLSSGLALFAHPVTTKGQFTGFLVSIILASMGLGAAELGKRWYKWEGMSLLLVLGLLSLLIAVFFQALAGVWQFSQPLVVFTFAVLLVLQVSISLWEWKLNRSQTRTL
ncbi:hypothetical protein EVS84_05460 [Pseudomonas koreensis]|uniref:Uncharacterized protein n=2 Tax=Pseudomonas TaxID=286 RepID=A0A4Q4L8K4_9PSED|nr:MULTISPECIES: hypothetical protein [Pseudomonas]MDM8190028.1 hypothetical protein [Pseudomonas fluorescens]MDP8571273.1 hypothetical protein [Pseudomonas iranensis]RYM43347.1 hypothetical protein EVS84_05460 [Pseudomonas koreensis]